ncbi:DUF2642 domain-containing protein [Pseudalkalibacillus berkeleyi]|uniref:DUF2642 domain-containing protein n=1 Tax=Pseudalkalibacillus berkeleyi TaxID=1069813 RepID=A0ABS9GXZ9_9BACL|nr:DUF2642 domain-containing protein [Pseudalkalibacillus berkeleyi]MCF6136631.1 DUF2642 domain-containing protein [Pseudalkalibacillus berkeleyi]
MSILNNFDNYIGEHVKMTASGKVLLSGILVDTGSNIVVLYDGQDFLYIPLVHVHYLDFNSDDGETINPPDHMPTWIQEDHSISLRKILTNAKGVFTEIFVTSNQSIHGYVTNVMNDYFTFFSPVHKTMFIPLQHLKWLIPYPYSHRPYSLSNKDLPLTPSNVPASRTFEEQCKRHLGKVAIFDMGKHPNKIGKLVKVENGYVEIIIARNKTIFTNLQHVQTVQFP